jgi:CheY-like chemotaxis protein
MPDVLIVEDDLSIADILQEVLEDQGYSVTGVARTVQEAIVAIDKHAPDFAIIDVKLAKGDCGTDVAAYLRKGTSTKIIFSTGNDNSQITALFGDAVMTKPYRLADVARGLRILEEIAEFGQTTSAYPRNFRLLRPAFA